MPNGKPKRGDSISVEEDEEEEDDDEAAADSPLESPAPHMNGKKGAQKKPETEEEKRRNFLERNRQGVSIANSYDHASHHFTHPAFDLSRTQMPSTEKGLVGPITGQE